MPTNGYLNGYLIWIDYLEPKSLLLLKMIVEGDLRVEIECNKLLIKSNLVSVVRKHLFMLPNW